jgi:hypothetical protein
MSVARIACPQSLYLALWSAQQPVDVTAVGVGAEIFATTLVASPTRVLASVRSILKTCLRIENATSEPSREKS